MKEILLSINLGLKISDKRLLFVPAMEDRTLTFLYIKIFLIKRYTIQQGIYHLTHVRVR